MKIALAATLLAAPLLAAIAAPARAQTAPIVQTAGGKVQGIATQGLQTFLGIPYGADTGGANRFLPARPAAPWTGVRPATKMGPRCAQPGHASSIIPFSDDPISEDCLVLNVWTPSAQLPAHHRPRAVMVWIHGGGFAFGSANDPLYDGASLAKKQDLVVVSLNHRLNGFGYMPLGPEAGPAYAQSANLGQLDLVLALQWVRDNIARFGGDPKNVTIFGQSGGGAKVALLLAMPQAHGLFQKAIVQSGAEVKLGELKEGLDQRDKVLAALGLKPADVLKLRDLPLADLLAAFDKAGLLGFRATHDGTVIATQPFDPAAPAISKNIPLLIGTAQDEATAILASTGMFGKLTEPMAKFMLASMIGAKNVDPALALYKAQRPNDSIDQTTAAIITDWGFTSKANTLSDRKSHQRGAPVYRYVTTWHSPAMNGQLRSPHGVELPFLFDTVASAPGLVGTDPHPELTKLYQSTFAAFARTGNPNVKGYPTWAPFTEKTRSIFRYDIKPSITHDPDPAIRKFWDAIDATK